MIQLSEHEFEQVKRARDRIRDLLFDHVLDLEGRLKGCELVGDPLGISTMIKADIEETRSAMEASGLGIFEQLRLWMDVIDAKGI